MTLELRHHLFRLFYSVVKFDDYLLKRSISIRISSTRGKRGHGPIECLADREGKKKEKNKKSLESWLMEFCWRRQEDLAALIKIGGRLSWREKVWANRAKGK